MELKAKKCVFSPLFFQSRKFELMGKSVFLYLCSSIAENSNKLNFPLVRQNSNSGGFRDKTPQRWTPEQNPEGYINSGPPADWRIDQTKV